jgi:hypothetical protein
MLGTRTNWWETYHNTHLNANAISWNEFKATFWTHYVPHGTLKLKKKEFSNVNQGSMTVNEYVNQFLRLRRSKICFSRVSIMRSSFNCSTPTT